MNKYYYLSMEIDEKSKTDLTLFRTAFSDAKTMVAFGNYRSEHGLKEAMPLLKKVKFSWDKFSVNPIGDIMGGNIYSKNATELFQSKNVDFEILEPIDVEGVPAYFISFKKSKILDDNLDAFKSETYRNFLVVTDNLKKAWESAGLLGANFEPIKLRT